MVVVLFGAFREEPPLEHGVVCSADRHHPSLVLGKPDVGDVGRVAGVLAILGALEGKEKDSHGKKCDKRPPKNPLTHYNIMQLQIIGKVSTNHRKS